MSIDPAATNNPTRYRTDDIPLHRPVSGRIPPDEPGPDIIDQTKQQIRTLVQEITELAKSNSTEEDFFRHFLTKTSSALASLGGVVWTREHADSPLRLLYHINLKLTPMADNSSAQIRHSRLLEKILRSGEAAIVPPNSGGENDDEAGNPTDFILLFAPVCLDGKTVSIVEIFQRPGGGPATQRGYLRFLVQMCELATDFVKSRRLKAFQEQQQRWAELDQFSRQIHSSLDLPQTAYLIANEGRRLVGCDRLSVATCRQRRCHVLAVSGLDSVERRAEQIKRLGLVASSVVRTQECLWFAGDDRQLAPQVEAHLHSYLDVAHSKLLGIIPLFDSSEPGNRRRQPIGALIVEQLTSAADLGLLRSRCEDIEMHAQTALQNATRYNSLFLMPLWKRLAWLSAPWQTANYPTTLLVTAFLVLAAALFILVPYPFSLGASGELVAEKQQEIFAQVDGKFVDIRIPEDPGEIVEAGAVLATMTNNDLAREIAKLKGEINELDNIVEKLRRQKATLENKQADEELFDILLQLDKAILERDFKHQLLILRQEDHQNLEIKAPIRGQVINWQARRNLLGRPVRRGHSLLTMVAPDTAWQLELFVPERRVGHLLAAQKSLQEPLPVSFSLASHPGTTYQGKVIKVDPLLGVHHKQENTARILISFDNQQVPPELLRSGTRTIAKIDCGQRCLGYVLFHELFESAKTSVLYWF